MLLTAAMLCAAGCTKPDDGGNGGNGNGGGTPNPNSGGAGCPKVETKAVTDITSNSAKSGGIITDNGDGRILEQGICWSTSGTPVVDNTHATATVGETSFTCTMSNLSPSTTYYVCAYAINTAGVGYGDVHNFKTASNNGGGGGGNNNSNLPVVETDVVNYISYNKAVCFGNVISGSGFEVTERGLCWSTQQNPTIGDNKVQCGNGLGEFIANITNLNASSTYYVRAYAINASGVGYSEERHFMTSTSPGIVPEGSIEGIFSISPTQRVWFSKGNLQYQASTNIWRFAENQYDFVGGTQTSQNVGVYGNVYENGVKCDNSEISSTYSGWIDLFGWSTSGYNHNNACFQPWSTSGTGQDYYAYGIATCNLYDKTGQADWGYHAISNGGNTIHSWKTLSREEWDFVLKTRDTYTGIRYAKAIVNKVKGVVLLPDDWSYTYYQLNSTNVPDASFDCNVITSIEWINTLQKYGAVFLPVSGGRANLSYVMMSNGSSWGRYWSSSCSEYAPSISASCAMITESHVTASDHYHSRGSGYSVRLVHVVE